FGSLDAQTRARMHELVQRLWMDRQKTVVFVTHDVHEALLLGTRVVVMAARPGRVLCDLEVRLPHPRDVDDASLAALAARVRAVLRDAEAGGGRKWDGDDASAARA
ncbi:MAG TPA: ABC transporter ATP-binding protein, partial [Myxococcaceae bacterium]|nr:ABC transporter ATP-binding protein [Myxococcaceae bacterium]